MQCAMLRLPVLHCLGLKQTLSTFMMFKGRLSELHNTMTSAVSDSLTVLSITSFPHKICMPSEAVVPLVITMQLFHAVTAAHIIVSDRSGLLTSVSALQKQIVKLSVAHTVMELSAI